MRHVQFADSSFLLDNETADLLVEYAALLIQCRSADSVVLNALSTNGTDIEMTILLSAGAPLVAESSKIDLPVPTNSVALDYMRKGMASLGAMTYARPIVETFAAETDPFEL